jgi:hypothetical protein
MKPVVESRIFELPEQELRLLFKPVQLRVIEKLSCGAPLSSNEKRYLRGRLGKKLRLVDSLARPRKMQYDGLGAIIGLLGEYYITGYEALKRNGFGWYYDTKRIEVVNTRLEGRLMIDGKSIVFRRARSIDPEWWAPDSSTGLKYATNERVLKDAQRCGQENLVKTWISMLERYRRLFVKYPRRYKKLLAAIGHYGEPEDYGV